MKKHFIFKSKILLVLLSLCVLLICSCGSTGASNDSPNISDDSQNNTSTDDKNNNDNSSDDDEEDPFAEEINAISYKPVANFVKEMGIGLNLGNTFDGFWEERPAENASNNCSGAQKINKLSDYETRWGANVTTKEMIDGMKAAGFCTVRIPVYWGNGMKNDGSFIITEALLNRVGEVIGYCLDNEMYAVINIHHYDEYIIKYFEKDKALEIFKSLWTQIAEYYKDYPDHLIFEGFNENVGSYRKEDDIKNGGIFSEKNDRIFEYANELNQIFVDSVRATGGKNSNRILIASGYWTNIDNTTNPKFKLPTDSVEGRLMISVHYVDNAMYWSKKIGSGVWKNYSIAQCELLRKTFSEKGVPVFLGECTGMYPSENFSSVAPLKTSQAVLKDELSIIVNYGFIPILWDTPNSFYDRDNCKIKNESDAKVISYIAEKFKN